METIASKVPEGWLVYELGQSPVHMLWFATLLQDVTDERGGISSFNRVFAEEYDTPEEALDAAIEKIKNGDIHKIDVK